MGVIEFKYREYKYKIEFRGKYTVIIGDSGIGKNTIRDVLMNYESDPDGIELKSDYNIVVEPEVEVMKNRENNVFVVDEDWVMLKKKRLFKFNAEIQQLFHII